MARLVHFGPVGDSENATKYSAGESNTGLPDDYSLHYRRMAAAQTELRYDVSGSGSGPTANRAATFRRFYIRVWRLPTDEQCFWFNSQTLNPSVAAGMLTITSAGVVNFYYKGTAAFPGTLIGTLGSVVLGQWHLIEVDAYFEVCVNAGVQANYFGGPIASSCGSFPLSRASLDGVSAAGSVFVANVGVGTTWTGYRDVLGRIESTNPSLDIDYTNFVCDDATQPPTNSRISAVKVAALGTFQQWTNAGNADWRARNTWPAVAIVAGGPTTGIRTITAAQKQTYLLESFTAAGITGSILGATAHINFPNAPATVPDLIVIRNGVEVDTATWVQINDRYLRYRLDTSLWTLTDTIELGIRSSVGTTRIASILMSVEHTTPVPPIVINDIQTVELSWTGNGTAQTVVLPFAPQLILWWPRTNATAGGLWSAEANNSQLIQTAGACDPNFTIRGTSLYLVGATGGGGNIAGVIYDALVIQDPKMRMVGAGAYADVNFAGRDDRDIVMLDPAGASFAPLTLLAVKEQIDITTSYRYYGPGIVGDASTPLNTTSPATADFIEALTATGFTAGLSLHTEVQQTSFVGFRRSRFTTLFLMDATSYVGDGAGGTRVIPVSLSGLVVKWAIVVPLNTTSRIIRNVQQTAGKRLQLGGGTVANTIEGLGTDSITVGTALNSNGITYSVLVFGYGTDPPPNITITKAAAVSPILAGDTASFTVTITNEGLAEVTDVSITDPLPVPSLPWVIGVPTTNPLNCTIVGGVLLCTGITLAGGGSFVVTVTALTTALEPDCVVQLLDNTAVVESPDEDPNQLTDNSASATILVNCPGCRDDWGTVQDDGLPYIPLSAGIEPPHPVDESCVDGWGTPRVDGLPYVPFLPDD